tara:strand:+ start:385 stop:867 length:483 start_codon:yes stop_codon:yes gene_type:complete
MNNIEKIRSMLNGTNRKIQVGPEPKTIHQREEGDRWTDGNGREWMKINGQRRQITKMPARGFDECKDCEKLILKQRDQDTYNRMQRCFHCQINFEVDLKAAGKWKEWVIDQETQRWKSIEKEVVAIMKEMKEDGDQAFDKSVALAVGNENISQQKQKLKK